MGPLLNVAYIYAMTGQHSEADARFRRVFHELAAACGVGHPLMAQALSQYAASLRLMGRTQEAKAVDKRVRSIQAVLDGDDPRRLSIDASELVPIK